jgi:Rod binding domain-containing protein
MSISSVTPAVPNPAGSVSADRNGRAAAALALGGNKKALAALPPDQQVKAVSGQFEAILLRQFMQDSVSKMMGGDSGGPSGSVYGYLLTDVLAGKLSEGGGLGLSKIFQQQLTPHAPHAPGLATEKTKS